MATLNKVMLVFQRVQLYVIALIVASLYLFFSEGFITVHVCHTKQTINNNFRLSFYALIFTSLISELVAKCENTKHKTQAKIARIKVLLYIYIFKS